MAVIDLHDACERAFRLGWERREELGMCPGPIAGTELRDDLARIAADDILRQIRLDTT